MGAKLFSLVLVLQILNKSWGIIPGCNYADTVDISHVPLTNGSYNYHGLQIPVHLTGIYDFEQLVGGNERRVKRHLRACVCKLRPCIRVCCPRNQISENGECSDKVKKELAEFQPYVNIFPKEETMEKRISITNIALQSDRFGFCDEFFDLSDDELIMFEDGNFGIQSQNFTMNKESFCLYVNQFSSDLSKRVLVVRHKCHEYENWQEAILEITIVVISLVCNILTIAVYLINRNRNMNFVCYVICVTMHHLMWILTKYANLLNETCTIAGYTRYFFAVGAILWLFVVSHRTRKGLMSMSLNDPRYRFRAYSVYVWGSTTFLTAAIILTDRIWGNDLSTLKWTPSVGFAQCWLYRNSFGMLIFFIGPILVLCNINGVMLILTIIHMLKTERKVKKSIRIKLSSASQTYLNFLRIGVMMGVTWILDLVPYFFRDNALLQKILWVAYYYHLSLGIVIFVLFVLKRGTLRILMKRLRCTKISSIIDV
ncbi:probable G-protein coupled receptor Mth-like 6 [Drosophila elegans]|uniref:probable G-protein coupled receptor Mth-like 6 n=1 Tax=Drosophila elegans TaxID=30023 RepID=UPI001BC85700|nr:probable G-protein coupled receptor Mth-like 6 [Drosophila elegans]